MNTENAHTIAPASGTIRVGHPTNNGLAGDHDPLPFVEREWVDVRRARRILGVGKTQIQRLADSGLIRLIDYKLRAWKRVQYQSLVEHCDRLRQEYAISDRRPPLSSPLLRHRDEDLLPFPLHDTIHTDQLVAVLGVSLKTVIHILEEGRFDCYRLHPGGEWRISRSSFLAWQKRAMQPEAGGSRAYHWSRTIGVASSRPQPGIRSAPPAPTIGSLSAG